MYADDTTLLCSSSNPLSLQSELNSNLIDKIAEWFDMNKLTLNIKKTKFMVFGTSYTLNNYANISLKFNEKDVERVYCFKYLGIYFDPNLSWDKQTEQVCSRVSQRIGLIRRIRYFLPTNTIKLLANTLVMPLFDYCSIVWSNCNGVKSDSLQVLQNRLARVVLHADIMTPVRDLMNLMEWRLLKDKWDDHILIMTYKSLKCMTPVYISSKFKFTNTMHSKNTRNQSSNTLIVPIWNNTQGKRTYHYRACKLWNELPLDIRCKFDTITFNVFKKSF